MQGASMYISNPATSISCESAGRARNYPNIGSRRVCYRVWMTEVRKLHSLLLCTAHLPLVSFLHKKSTLCELSDFLAQQIIWLN